MNQTNQMELNTSVPYGLPRLGEKPNKTKEKRIPVRNLKYELPVMLFVLGAAGATAAAFGLLALDWGKVISRLPKLAGVAAQMCMFSTDMFHLTLTTLLETITVTVLATIYGLLMGLFVGALGARNITPFKPLASLIQCILSFLRAVPTQVWVLLILASMGFGMSAGIVGLSFHVVAFFGKVFAQAFEEVPDETIEALRATGANPVQVFCGAVLPASFTALIAWTALRFEINFNEASILGMVGAGGIGYTVMAAMNSYKLGRAGLAVLLIFLFAWLVEMGTTRLKRKLRI